MRWGRGDRVTRLTSRDYERARALCAADPVGSVLAAVHLDALTWGSSTMLGYLGDGQIRSLLWSGSNVVPVGTTAGERDRYASFLSSRVRRATSIVGNADEGLDLARLLEEAWGAPTEVRGDQPNMVATATTYPADPLVRPATREDGPMVAPASIAMYTEEVGYDPTEYGPGYVSRVFELCRKGHTFIRTGIGPDGSERVEFKADIGALALGVAQIQGVWTVPDLRGQGLASAGMAAVINLVTRSIAPTVSLYVNAYNHAALRVYERVGFRQVGTFATVLY